MSDPIKKDACDRGVPSKKRWRSRLAWWWQTRDCECHWHEPFGRVVMAGCPIHDSIGFEIEANRG